MKTSVQLIQYKDTFDLREKILNPGQSENLKRPGDEIAIHFGAYLEGSLVGVISFYEQNKDGTYQKSHWRIRGMAIESDYQNQGIGTMLIDFGLKQLEEKGEIMEIWCNSRKDAIPLYRKFGLVEIEKLSTTIQDHPSSTLMSTLDVFK